ncbi:hypothetical protein OPIT5_23820 [Opitutaceae bacterium TAV5]|nr:hypothetical protein OPIT5_23820 [Opitutaceae bacterium TAV5]
MCRIIKSTLLFFSFVSAACAASGEPAASALIAPGANLGMWVWHREEVVEPAARRELLAFSQRHGITTLLVQVRFDARKPGARLADPDAYRALLTEARAVGIAVEALDAYKTMGFEQNRAVTLQTLAAVLAFHRNLPPGSGFAGIHYDIEPYLSDRWKNGDEAGIMKETLVTFAAIREQVKAADPALTVAHDIPAWYDRHQKLSIEFNGVRKNFHEHIQDLSDYVGIMSYRTKATGPNSVTAISAEELAYAARIGRLAYPSIETVQLKKEPQITFYGRSAESFLETVRGVHAELQGSAGYGGILLHQYRTLRLLLEGGEGSAPASAK